MHPVPSSLSVPKTDEKVKESAKIDPSAAIEEPVVADPLAAKAREEMFLAGVESGGITRVVLINDEPPKKDYTNSIVTFLFADLLDEVQALPSILEWFFDTIKGTFKFDDLLNKNLNDAKELKKALSVEDRLLYSIFSQLVLCVINDQLKDTPNLAKMICSICDLRLLGKMNRIAAKATRYSPEFAPDVQKATDQLKALVAKLALENADTLKSILAELDKKRRANFKLIESPVAQEMAAFLQPLFDLLHDYFCDELSKEIQTIIQKS